jgi:hypothetical protein
MELKQFKNVETNPVKKKSLKSSHKNKERKKFKKELLLFMRV